MTGKLQLRVSELERELQEERHHRLTAEHGHDAALRMRELANETVKQQRKTLDEQHETIQELRKAMNQEIEAIDKHWKTIKHQQYIIDKEIESNESQRKANEEQHKTNERQHRMIEDLQRTNARFVSEMESLRQEFTQQQEKGHSMMENLRLEFTVERNLRTLTRIHNNTVAELLCGPEPSKYTRETSVKASDVIAVPGVVGKARVVIDSALEAAGIVVAIRYLRHKGVEEIAFDSLDAVITSLKASTIDKYEVVACLKASTIDKKYRKA